MRYAKHLNRKLCTGLTLSEFQCRCNNTNCLTTKISKDFLVAYKAFRELLGVSLAINSGYRCDIHNSHVGGVKSSRHLMGCAIDISLKTLDHLSQEEIEHAAKVSGFKFIKFYESFFHADTRE